MVLLKTLPVTPGKKEFTWSCLRTPLLPTLKAPWWHPRLGEATTEPQAELAVMVRKIFKPLEEEWGTL